MVAWWHLTSDLCVSDAIFVAFCHLINTVENCYCPSLFVKALCKAKRTPKRAKGHYQQPQTLPIMLLRAWLWAHCVECICNVDCIVAQWLFVAGLVRHTLRGILYLPHSKSASIGKSFTLSRKGYKTFGN